MRGDTGAMLRGDVAESFNCFASCDRSLGPALETIETFRPSRDVRLKQSPANGIIDVFPAKAGTHIGHGHRPSPV
jgi:hypothetical protein